MILISLLLCLAVEKYTTVGEQLKRFAWFDAYVAQLRKWIAPAKLWQAWLGVAVVVLPLSLVVAILLAILSKVLGLLSVLAAVFVLLYCFGPASLPQDMERYITSFEKSEPAQQTELKTAVLQSKPVPGKAESHRAMTETLFLRANHELFAVIFWYIILGPVGAVIYRLSHLLYQRAQDKSSDLAALASYATQWLTLIDWLPLRISATLYALVGDFSHGFKTFLQKDIFRLLPDKAWFKASVMGSLMLGDAKKADFNENKMAYALIERGFYLGLVMVALFTLGAWIS